MNRTSIQRLLKVFSLCITALLSQCLTPSHAIGVCTTNASAHDAILSCSGWSSTELWHWTLDQAGMSLQELRVDNNDFPFLPTYIFNGPMYQKRLRTISLTNNNIEFLPAQNSVFAKVKGAIHLDLSNNRLSSLPQTMFLAFDHLEELYLDNNQLTTLPDNLFNRLQGKLRFLSVDNNSLKLLRPEFVKILMTSDSMKWSFLNNSIVCNRMLCQNAAHPAQRLKPNATCAGTNQTLANYIRNTPPSTCTSVTCTGSCERSSACGSGSGASVCVPYSINTGSCSLSNLPAELKPSTSNVFLDFNLNQEVVCKQSGYVNFGSQYAVCSVAKQLIAKADCRNASCNSSVCNGNGVCSFSHANQVTCQCYQGYTGPYCDVELATCSWWTYGAKCLPCNCDPRLSDGCNSTTGQCICKLGHTGHQCDRCGPGRYYVEGSPSGGLYRQCVSCPCHSGRFRTDDPCDPITGKCNCITGWHGDQCQHCGDLTSRKFLAPDGKCYDTNTVNCIKFLCPQEFFDIEWGLNVPCVLPILKNAYHFLRREGIFDKNPLRVHCSHGFNWRGITSFNVTCNQSLLERTPSAGTLSCALNSTFCPVPPLFENVTLSRVARTYKGQAEYKCDGILVVRNGSGLALTCNASHIWEGPEPACEVLQCPELYYRDVTVNPPVCVRSRCHAGGASSCDIDTGECFCKANVTGPTCSECKRYFSGNVPDCKPCQCSQDGDIADCDSVTGTCICTNGKVGARCDTCLGEEFSLGAGKCQPCHCNTRGSVHTLCHKLTGQCACHVNVTGRRCDTCPMDHVIYQLANSNSTPFEACAAPKTIGCHGCNCSSVGSLGCVQISGQCTCRPGYTGLKCSECLNASQLLTTTGCVAKADLFYMTNQSTIQHNASATVLAVKNIVFGKLRASTSAIHVSSAGVISLAGLPPDVQAEHAMTQSSGLLAPYWIAEQNSTWANCRAPQSRMTTQVIEDVSVVRRSDTVVDDIVNTISNSTVHQSNVVKSSVSPPPFLPKTLVIVTWEGLMIEGQFPRANSFQAILASDGFQTYAMFHYPNNSLDVTTSTGAVVGVLDQVHAVSQGNTSSLAGQTLVYQVTPKTSVEEIECRTVKKDLDFSSDTIPCPSDLDAAKVTYTFSYFKDKPSDAATCYRSSFPVPVANRTLQVTYRVTSVCCYDYVTGSRVLLGNAKSYVSFHDDDERKLAACAAADMSPYFFDRRNDPSLSKEEPAMVQAFATGDPHVRSFDATSFEFNPLGQHRLFKLTSHSFGAELTLEANALLEQTQDNTFNWTSISKVHIHAEYKKDSLLGDYKETLEDAYIVTVNNGSFNRGLQLTHVEVFSFNPVNLSAIAAYHGSSVNKHPLVFYNTSLNDSIIFAIGRMAVTVHRHSNMSLTVGAQVARSMANAATGMFSVNQRDDTHFLAALKDDTKYSQGNTANKFLVHYGLFEIQAPPVPIQYPLISTDTAFAIANQSLVNESLVLCGDDLSCQLDYIKTGDEDLAHATRDAVDTLEQSSLLIGRNVPSFSVSYATGKVAYPNRTFAIVITYNMTLFNLSLSNRSLLSNGISGFVNTSARNLSDDVLWEWTPTHYTVPSGSPEQQLIFVLTEKNKPLETWRFRVPLVFCGCNGMCQDPPTSASKPYLELHCVQCAAGYTGLQCHDNLDLCNPVSPCHPSRLCNDLPPPSLSFSCSPCSSGFITVGTTQCRDIDECPSRCNHTSLTCANKPGSYSCKCQTGYTSYQEDATTTGPVCEDVDECLTESHYCSISNGSECVNTAGSYECQCITGYAGDALNYALGCRLVDDCAITQTRCGGGSYCEFDPADGLTKAWCICPDSAPCAAEAAAAKRVVIIAGSVGAALCLILVTIVIIYFVRTNKKTSEPRAALTAGLSSYTITAGEMTRQSTTDIAQPWLAKNTSDTPLDLYEEAHNVEWKASAAYVNSKEQMQEQQEQQLEYGIVDDLKNSPSLSKVNNSPRSVAPSPSAIRRIAARITQSEYDLLYTDDLEKDKRECDLKESCNDMDGQQNHSSSCLRTASRTGSPLQADAYSNSEAVRRSSTKSAPNFNPNKRGITPRTSTGEIYRNVQSRRSSSVSSVLSQAGNLVQPIKLLLSRFASTGMYEDTSSHCLEMSSGIEESLEYNVAIGSQQENAKYRHPLKQQQEEESGQEELATNYANGKGISDKSTSYATPHVPKGSLLSFLGNRGATTDSSHGRKRSEKARLLSGSSEISSGSAVAEDNASALYCNNADDAGDDCFIVNGDSPQKMDCSQIAAASTGGNRGSNEQQVAGIDSTYEVPVSTQPKSAGPTQVEDCDATYEACQSSTERFAKPEDSLAKRPAHALPVESVNAADGNSSSSKSLFSTNRLMSKFGFGNKPQESQRKPLSTCASTPITVNAMKPSLSPKPKLTKPSNKAKGSSKPELKPKPGKVLPRSETQASDLGGDESVYDDVRFESQQQKSCRRLVSGKKVSPQLPGESEDAGHVPKLQSSPALVIRSIPQLNMAGDSGDMYADCDMLSTGAISCCKPDQVSLYGAMSTVSDNADLADPNWAKKMQNADGRMSPTMDTPDGDSSIYDTAAI